MQLIGLNKKYDVMKTKYPINNGGFVINFMSKQNARKRLSIYSVAYQTNKVISKVQKV